MSNKQSSFLYNEQWKYIDISSFQKNKIFNQSIVYDNQVEGEQVELINNCLLDSKHSERIVLCSIEDAKKNHSELYDKYFNQLCNKSISTLISQNSNNFSGGLFLYVPPNLIVEDLIEFD